jgi:glycogen debranching enzyme-like protein
MILPLISLRPRYDTLVLNHDSEILVTSLDGFVHPNTASGLFVHRSRALSKYYYSANGESFELSALSAISHNQSLGYYIHHAGFESLIRINIRVSLFPQKSERMRVRLRPIYSFDEGVGPFGDRAKGRSATDRSEEHCVFETTLVMQSGGALSAASAVRTISRARSDLAMLRLKELDVRQGWVPAAGPPMYVGFFGRDVLRKLRVEEADVDLAFRRDEQGRTDFVINEVTGVLDVMRVD